MRNKFDITHPLAILLAFTTMALALPLPTWLTIIFTLWLTFSLIALLYTADTTHRDFITGTLRHRKFTQVYSLPAQKVVNWLWSRYCNDSYQGNGLAITFRHATTWQLYDKAMLLAVLYPIWALVLMWIITGQDAKLGDAVVFPADAYWPERAAATSTLVILVFGVLARQSAAATQHRVMRQAADWVPLLALALALAVAGALAVAITEVFIVAVAGTVLLSAIIAVAIAGSGAFAGAFALAGAVTFTSAGIFAGALAAAGPFSGATVLVGSATLVGTGTIAILTLAEKGKHRLALWLVTLALLAVWVSLLPTLPWANINILERGLFLFLGVFPLINALFDTVSYAVTLTLLRLGLRAKHPVFYGLLDLAIAMVLFFVLGATLILLIPCMNALAGISLFNLDALFEGIRAQPSDYGWLYLMMFSTLLPTAAHVAFALLSLQSIIPLFVRRYVATLLQSSPAHTLNATLAPFAVGAVWSVPFFIVGWGVVLAWPYAGGLISGIGWFYLDTLSELSQFLGN